MGFSRQEYWTGLPLPSPRNCLQGIKSESQLTGQCSRLGLLRALGKQKTREGVLCNWRAWEALRQDWKGVERLGDVRKALLNELSVNKGVENEGVFPSTDTSVRRCGGGAQDGEGR